LIDWLIGLRMSPKNLPAKPGLLNSGY